MTILMGRGVMDNVGGRHVEDGGSAVESDDRPRELHGLLVRRTAWMLEIDLTG